MPGAPRSPRRQQRLDRGDDRCRRLFGGCLPAPGLEPPEAGPVWAASIGIDFVAGRETGLTDLISPGSSWPAPSLLAKKTVRSRTRVPDLACCGVGLRGLEPLTSSLSGKRSNRLSYRPGRTALCLGRLSHRALTSQPRSVLCQGDLDASQQACRQVVHEGAKRCDGGD
jgi:hypothetical protein